MPVLTNCASFINNLVDNGGFDCDANPWVFYDRLFTSIPDRIFSTKSNQRHTRYINPTRQIIRPDGKS